jgi:RimJ/RimL family protein N-acetyltransferase
VTSAADEHSAEIAVTVGDAWQGRGVGSALAAMLVQRAREEGIEHLTAFVLADNVRSLRMLHRAGFRATARDAGTVELALSL